MNKNRSPRYLFLIPILISLSGCYGTYYHYDYGLLRKSTISKESDTLKTLVYKDDKIDIIFSIGVKSVNFNLKNKTEDVIKIIWDEASFVKFGKTHRVMHQGVKYNDRNSSQPPTVIPSQASLDDLVVPTDNVYWQEGFYSQYGSSPGKWKEYDLFLQYDLNNPKLKEEILSSIGKKFSVYLPIQYKGKTLDYTFNFIITNVQATTKRAELNR